MPFLLLLLVGLPAAADERHGIVQWIYDGDTLLVQGVGKVRLLGIDVPESEDSPRDRFYLERFRIPRPLLRRIARQARVFAIEQAKGRQVRLEIDREERDQYQRLLAYVYLPDDRLLNGLLLEQGLAVVFRRYDFYRKPQFLSAEERARSARLGLWQQQPDQ
jgi:micrococcal nuclease